MGMLADLFWRCYFKRWERWGLKIEKHHWSLLYFLFPLNAIVNCYQTHCRMHYWFVECANYTCNFWWVWKLFCCMLPLAICFSCCYFFFILQKLLFLIKLTFFISLLKLSPLYFLSKNFYLLYTYSMLMALIGIKGFRYMVTSSETN